MMWTWNPFIVPTPRQRGRNLTLMYDRWSALTVSDRTLTASQLFSFTCLTRTFSSLSERPKKTSHLYHFGVMYDWTGPHNTRNLWDSEMTQHLKSRWEVDWKFFVNRCYSKTVEGRYVPLTLPSSVTPLPTPGEQFSVPRSGLERWHSLGILTRGNKRPTGPLSQGKPLLWFEKETRRRGRGGVHRGHLDGQCLGTGGPRDWYLPPYTGSGQISFMG